MLSEVPINPGDVLFIPAGTVHAILEGSLMYEVQETSDTTLRLYDWGRLDASGKPRPLQSGGMCCCRTIGSAYRPLPPDKCLPDKRVTPEPPPRLPLFCH